MSYLLIRIERVNFKFKVLNLTVHKSYLNIINKACCTKQNKTKQKIFIFQDSEHGIHSITF